MNTLSLILPALIPSWRFFRTIEPSPRVDWAFVPENHNPPDWQPYASRPTTVAALDMVLRLIWNPHWNDSLFVVSCAERIQNAPTDHSIREIRRRVLAQIAQSGQLSSSRQALFRLVFVRRDGSDLVEEVLFHSDPFPVPAPQ
ncbi:MAG: hypothetical protein AAFQ66_09745 [Pseudomonadota bacterium]